MRYQPIENYGVIGDQSTAALIGMNGSIDFFCFPEFDSPSVFAALLDAKLGGYFKIHPLQHDLRYKQMYLPDTNILLTRFLDYEGVGEILDFMPVADEQKPSMLVRRVMSVRGDMTFRLHCRPRFNYGQASHIAYKQGDAIIFESQGKDRLLLKLSSSIPLKIIKQDGFAQFTLKPKESAVFILEDATQAIEDIDLSKFVTESLFSTMHYWRSWIRHSQYNGRWRETVNRSALVLKLLISRKYGSMIAAPTFSLPEVLGGSKNWDYRYNWIRDAAFAVYGLIRLGYTQEAGAFMKWIEKVCEELGDTGRLGLMYTIRGNAEVSERILKNFEGYKGSRPVRIGNDAYKQLQLDIYGELMDAVYLYNKYGQLISHDFWENLAHQINWLCNNWEQKDHSIWEVRGYKKDLLYSRLMCWVAFDRAIRLAEKRSLPKPRRWEEERDKVYYSIFEEFWNPTLQSFVQAKGSNQVDAALLMMPLVRFISPVDPRWLSTLKCIEESLSSDTLIYRFRSGQTKHTSLHADEGTFSICSFWFVECLARAGQLQKARYYFEKMLSYANHLGLYSEQLGFEGEHLGNFPQSFTHLGLISAAYYLNKSLDEKKDGATHNIKFPHSKESYES